MQRRCHQCGGATGGGEGCEIIAATYAAPGNEFEIGKPRVNPECNASRGNSWKAADIRRSSADGVQTGDVFLAKAESPNKYFGESSRENWIDEPAFQPTVLVPLTRHAAHDYPPLQVNDR